VGRETLTQLVGTWLELVGRRLTELDTSQCKLINDFQLNNCTVADNSHYSAGVYA